MPVNRESLILDSVELNDLTGSYVLREVDFTPPRKRPEWVQGADADGAELVRDPLVENRTITASLRVAQQATMDLALSKIAAIVAKLEEAEQQPDGLPLVWTPANATSGMTFYVLSGEINGIPVTREGPDRGWLLNYPIVNLTLTCKPYGEGAELGPYSATASTPLVSVDVAHVPGDVPAKARILVTDAAGQPRRDALWGLEQRYYTPGTPAPLLLQGTDFVTTGFAGAATVVTGSYGTGNPVGGPVAGQPTALLGVGNQPHVGSFRVRARVQVANTVARVRLAWRDGDGPLGANPWIPVPTAGGWCEVDLGPITITPARLGSQRWTARVEAYTTDGTSQNVYVNLLELIPAAEGYGRARAAYTYRPGAVVARDDFAGFGAGNLNGRTAPLGGAWTTAGTTGDFTGFGNDAARATVDTITGRYGVLGAAMTDTEATARVYASAYNSNDAYMGVVARYVDANNALRAYINTKQNVFSVSPIVAGSSSAFNAPPITLLSVGYRIRLVVFASGAVYATLMDDTYRVLSTITLAPGAIPSLSAGGALASGKAGIVDIGMAGGFTREYDDFSAAVPPSEPIVAYASQRVEFRHDGVLRADSAGTYYGQPPAYRGGRALIPAAGDRDRTSRVVAAARRNDTDVATDGGVTDSTTLSVYVTPRYLAVPH